MRLSYNIIWFENDDGWLKPALKNLRGFLEDHGFILEPSVESSGQNLDQILGELEAKVRDVDIILMDYKLTGNDNGDSLIKRIRERKVYTEILFYSQDDNVKQVIEAAHGSFEGIYYSGRDNFLQKTKDVIWHTIKKVEDIESMRGLIMGVVSEIDSEMLEILAKYLELSNEDEKQQITDDIFKEVDSYLNSKKKQFDLVARGKKIEKLIKDPLLFDADKKAIALQMVIDLLKDPQLTTLTNKVFYNSYKEKVIKTRNIFGHVTVIIEDGIRKLKSKSSEEAFTDDRCIEIRKTLMEYVDKMELIKEIISKRVLPQ